MKKIKKNYKSIMSLISVCLLIVFIALMILLTVCSLVLIAYYIILFLEMIVDIVLNMSFITEILTIVIGVILIKWLFTMINKFEKRNDWKKHRKLYKIINKTIIVILNIFVSMLLILTIICSLVVILCTFGFIVLFITKVSSIAFNMSFITGILIIVIGAMLIKLLSITIDKFEKRNDWKKNKKLYVITNKIIIVILNIFAFILISSIIIYSVNLIIFHFVAFIIIVPIMILSVLKIMNRFKEWKDMRTKIHL